MGVFAIRPSPVQVSWLGYPTTTGLKTIHYRITDPIANPEGENDPYYTEQLIRLPSSYICFEPPISAPAVRPREQTNAIRFGSFNNLTKISPITIDCWTAVLLKVPNSSLLLRSSQLSNQSTQDYLHEEFKLRGIRPERLEMEIVQGSVESRLDAYNSVDLSLIHI